MANKGLVSLFQNHPYVEKLQQGLPKAFAVADAESRRIQQRRGGKTYESIGQEVGVARERILVAFLRYALGDMHIQTPTANSPMRDVLVFGLPLEIKTSTKDGLVTAKWTADTESANRDISSFEFTADLLLVRIWWGAKKDSLYYIPVEALQETANGHKPAGYLSSAQGTNNRGIKITNWFMSEAQGHPGTIRVPVDWRIEQVNLDPMGRWMGYWSGQGGRDPLYG